MAINIQGELEVGPCELTAVRAAPAWPLHSLQAADNGAIVTKRPATVHRTKKEAHGYAYVYMYICMNVCICEDVPNMPSRKPRRCIFLLMVWINQWILKPNLTIPT